MKPVLIWILESGRLEVKRKKRSKYLPLNH